MLITAAHCAYDADAGTTVNDLVFAPDYRDGDGPTGLWKVKKVVVDDRWAKSQDEDLDVAFLILDKKNGKQIQDVLGGNTLGIDRGYDNEVKITGYPTSRETPISCQNRTTKFSDTQMRIQCTDFEGGTSGSPWLADYDPPATPARSSASWAATRAAVTRTMSPTPHTSTTMSPTCTSRRRTWTDRSRRARMRGHALSPGPRARSGIGWGAAYRPGSVRGHPGKR